MIYQKIQEIDEDIAYGEGAEGQMSEEGQDTDTVKSQLLTPQNLAKAVRKVHKSLPKNPETVPELSVGKLVYQLSPQKRKAVIQLVTSMQSGARSKGTS